MADTGVAERTVRAAILTCVLAGVLATSATADVGADFEAAFEIFVPGGNGIEPPAVEAMMDMVAALQGRWMPASVVFGDGVYDAEVAPRACAPIVFEITPTGRLTFDLTQVTDDGPTGHLVSYSWVEGMTFSRSADLDGQLEFLFRDMVDSLGPAVWASALSTDHLHGYAQLHRVGTDVLVISAAQALPVILTRCP